MHKDPYRSCLCKSFYVYACWFTLNISANKLLFKSKSAEMKLQILQTLQIKIRRLNMSRLIWICNVSLQSLNLNTIIYATGCLFYISY